MFINLSYTKRNRAPLKKLYINLGWIPLKNFHAVSSLYTVIIQLKKPVYFGSYYVKILVKQTSIGLVIKVANKLAITRSKYLFDNFVFIS